MVTYRSLSCIGYPRYRVGDDGSVWRLKWTEVVGNIRRVFWKRLKVWYIKDYPNITLSKNGTQKNFQVQFLVLVAFVGPRPEGCVARHYPDRNPRNVKLSNLSWATWKTNTADRDEHGTMGRGEESTSHVLTKEQVKEAIRLRKEDRKFWKWKVLAQRYGVSQPTIWNAASAKGRTWRHFHKA